MAGEGGEVEVEEMTGEIEEIIEGREEIREKEGCQEWTLDRGQCRC